MFNHISRDAKNTIAAFVGTLFEWYNFYLYGVLTKVIGQNFFVGLDESNVFLFSLLTFLVGFLVRPFGGVLFGYIGDIYGKKKAFETSMLLMVVSTATVAILPNFQSIGIFAPIVLVFLRILQGMAIGGEYGAAICFLDETLQSKRKSFFWSFIQSAASLGLSLALISLLLLKNFMGENFESYGWRILFLLSIPMYSVSVFLREDIVERVDELTHSVGKRRIKFFDYVKSLIQKSNLNKGILLILAVTMGQAVIWYVGHFYSLFYMTKILHLKEDIAQMILSMGILFSCVAFYFYGYFIDSFSKFKMMLLAFIAFIVFSFFLFDRFRYFKDSETYVEMEKVNLTVYANSKDCHFTFDLVAKAKYKSSCDILRNTLSSKGLNFKLIYNEKIQTAYVDIQNTKLMSFDGNSFDFYGYDTKMKRLNSDLDELLFSKNIKYKTPFPQSFWGMVLIQTLLILLVVFVYTPIPMILVQAFDKETRFGALSFVYHFGNGVFGGLVPGVAFFLITSTGKISLGLAYPMLICFFSILFLLIIRKKGIL